MSLVSVPGRGGAPTGSAPHEIKLVVDKHVEYIQSLDTVRPTGRTEELCRSSLADSGKMSWNIG